MATKANRLDPLRRLNSIQAVLLRAVRRDELLLQAVAAYQLRETATGENQAVILTQQEGFRNTSQDAEPGNQRLLQGCLGSAGLATLRQVPTQQFPCMTVDHQGQAEPAIPTTPDTAQIG